MAPRNKVELRIAGRDYTIVGAEPEEYIQRVGLYVDKKMTEIMRNNNKLSTSLAAVLTAINISDDYFKSRESELNAKKELKKALEELARCKEERHRLMQENTVLNNTNTNLKLELAKREAELNEVRNALEAERAKE
ncbi:MAG: cell division protein ZapA [Acetivibrionales bacterium]